MIDQLLKNAQVLESTPLTTKGKEDPFRRFPIREEIPTSLEIRIREAHLCAQGVLFRVEAPSDAQFKVFHFKTVELISGLGGYNEKALEIFLCALGAKGQSTQEYTLLVSEKSLPPLQKFNWVKFRTQQEVSRLENLTLGVTLSPVGRFGHSTSFIDSKL